ncbi:MAG TPA: XRE family transcriptional regulator [Planctomycetaceae bacterium]|nr:XRE family transcriptional regulator [Planctomycetaceae bacterium]
MSEFGAYLRKVRETRRAMDRSFSVRQLAARVGVEPSCLSKIERGQQPPPSAETTVSLADELDEDAATADAGAPVLDKLKSVAELSANKGDMVLPGNESVTPENLVVYRTSLKEGQVREGAF